MKKAYLILTAAVIVTAVALLLSDLIGNNPEYQPIPTRVYPDDYLDDQEYVIYPSDSTDKWNIIFPSGDLYVELKPEQIALFMKSGEINPDTTWVIYPQCEYQLTLEDKEIVVQDFGRPVIRVPYEKAGPIGKALIEDNE